MTPPRSPDGRFDEQETWPSERWQRFQRRLLRAQLRHAYRDLPFYRRRLEEAGLADGTLRGPEDFARMPLLTKADVLDAMRSAKTFAVGIERLNPGEATVLGMSSGTLGTAVLVYSRSWRQATAKALARAYWWAGLRPGMRIMIAAPAWHSMALQETWVVEKLGALCVVPWGTFLPRFAGGFLDTLIEQKPSLVTTFLPMLYAIIAECRRRDIDLARAFSAVDTVLVVGAPMTARARQRLREDLGVRELLEGAGSAEGLLAMECEAHEAHHYFIDACYVEIVDPSTLRPLPPGRRGSVVVSSLVPHGSVYLRYDTEDIGEILAEPCPCGRTWPRLEIYDRRSNQFRVRDRELLWYDVRACLDEVPELVGLPFAVIRAAGPSSHLRIAMEGPHQADRGPLARRIEALSASRLGVPVRLEWVEGMPVRWKGVTVINERQWSGDRG